MKSDNFNNLDDMESSQHALLKACVSSFAFELEKNTRIWENEIVMDELNYSSMRIVPLFLDNIQKAGIVTKYDNRLKIIYKHWWLRTQHILNQAKTVHQELLKENINPAIIKGLALLSYYEKPEMRPMADFDLLIRPEEISTALVTLKRIGYVPHDQSERLLSKHPKLATDFKHSIECIHTITDTKLDLHWKIGSFCSMEFTEKLINNLETCHLLPNAKKPVLAYEVFMIIIHAVIYGAEDNLNWIIDIDKINSKADQSVWDEARQLAVFEKKQDLFDYGCGILNSYEIETYNKTNNQKDIRIIVPINYDAKKRYSRFHLILIKIRNFGLFIKYLYPRKNILYKLYESLRRAWLFIVSN